MSMRRLRTLRPPERELRVNFAEMLQTSSLGSNVNRHRDREASMGEHVTVSC